MILSNPKSAEKAQRIGQEYGKKPSETDLRRLLPATARSEAWVPRQRSGSGGQ